ncbi:anoctamin-8-like [Dermatophagoides farinae]
MTEQLEMDDDHRHQIYFPYTNLLSSLQRQTILIDLLSNWQFHRRNEEDEFSLQMTENELIIDKLLQNNQIDQLFALHQEDDLNILKTNWVAKLFHRQPLDQICSYFGIRIAIYFAFIGFYTEYLVYPMLYGALIIIFPYIVDYLPTLSISPFTSTISDKEYLNSILSFLFPVFNLFWSTLWLNRWHSHSQRLTYEWIRFIPERTSNANNAHSCNNDDDHQRRKQQQNDDHLHPLFDLIGLSRKIFQYFVTFPIIGLCLIMTFTVMFKIFIFQTWWDTELVERLHYPEWTGIIPKVMFAIILNIINYFYYLIVIWLNEKEKHRNFERKENQLIVKLFLFQFLNSYLPLFYIAFYLADIDKLKEQLAAQLITRQVIGNLNETLWPFLKESLLLAWLSSSKYSGDKCPNNDESEVSKGELESCMYGYHSTFDDYLEIVIQYGYVMLFTPVFPLAPLCAFLNNLIEIRTDAFKLCFVYQRPFIDVIQCRRPPSKTITIGVWKNVLEFLSIIAIISNCALMAINGQLTGLFSPFFIHHQNSKHRIIIIAVFIEHILLFIKWLIPVIFPINQFNHHHHHRLSSTHDDTKNGHE